MKKKATMIYADPENGWTEVPCEVELTEYSRNTASSIRITYKEDGEDKAYSGVASCIPNDGHYALDGEAPIKNGMATLHTMDGRVFEGSYVENGWHGLWKIELK
jgi:hypothetical protein